VINKTLPRIPSAHFLIILNISNILFNSPQPQEKDHGRLSQDPPQGDWFQENIKDAEHVECSGTVSVDSSIYIWSGTWGESGVQGKHLDYTMVSVHLSVPVWSSSRSSFHLPLGWSGPFVRRLTFGAERGPIQGTFCSLLILCTWIVPLPALRGLVSQRSSRSVDHLAASAAHVVHWALAYADAKYWLILWLPWAI
jgi:hypothetical protein